MLYQDFGILDSSRTYFVVSFIAGISSLFDCGTGVVAVGPVSSLHFTLTQARRRAARIEVVFL
jgi:hypothetical protein